MIQANSLEVIKVIQDSSLIVSNSSLIRRIHSPLIEYWTLVIQHIPREINKIVDCMAKLAFDTGQNLTMFKEISREVLAIAHIVKASVSLTHKLSV